LHSSFVMLGLVIAAHAADWNSAEQQLAGKIVAVAGSGAVTLAVGNRSSIGQRDCQVIQDGLRRALEGQGLRLVKPEQAAAAVTITLSENPASYVWVAQIHKATGEAAVVMVSTPRTEGSTAARDSVPLSLRQMPLWTQDAPILDVVVLEETTTPTRIAVLDPDRVALYRWQGGKWEQEQEQALAIVHARPWPRDLRGRLVPAGDHLLDAYLPGVICSSTTSTPLGLKCRESDDPWPLAAGTMNGGTMSVFPSAGLANGAATLVPQIKAFFAPARNFFTGALTPGVGKFTTVPKFYSAAFLVRDLRTVWLFAATDGQVYVIDGVSEQTGQFGWGSDLATVRTQCGAGWQVLASSSGEPDSVRAYEFPDRDPVAVSSATDFSGAITALWTEARGDTAVAVVRNRETDSYAAFRLAVACTR
jgi:hypothetical protein